MQLAPSHTRSLNAGNYNVEMQLLVAGAPVLTLEPRRQPIVEEDV